MTESRFLTFPQCPLSENNYEISSTTGTECKFFIARELHGDGEPHLHAYIHFGRRRRFASADCFDVDGYHPNIQKPRSARDVVAYCGKDDDTPLANFTPDTLPGAAAGWGDILQQSECKGDFLERVRQRFPRDYVLSLERLLSFCEWKYGRENTQYGGRGRSEFLEPDTLKEWTAVERPKSLLFIGASRIGKTEWARSLGEAMYFCGQFNLDDWNSDAKYIILDDFNIKFFPAWKSFFGCQKSFVLTDKYRKKRTVQWGKPCIWLCNDDGDPRRTLSGAESTWLWSNCLIYESDNPLFE
ncbi:replication-associated protein [robinz virus RP_428]|nr:replication-associated protein [robinz virus RP_428]